MQAGSGGAAGRRRSRSPAALAVSGRDPLDLPRMAWVEAWMRGCMLVAVGARAGLGLATGGLCESGGGSTLREIPRSIETRNHTVLN